MRKDLYSHLYNAELSKVNQRKTEEWRVLRKDFFKKRHIDHLTWYNLWKWGFGILLGLNRSSKVSPSSSSETKFIESINESTADNWSTKATITYKEKLNTLADGWTSWTIYKWKFTSQCEILTKSLHATEYTADIDVPIKNMDNGHSNKTPAFFKDYNVKS